VKPQTLSHAVGVAAAAGTSANIRITRRIDIADLAVTAGESFADIQEAVYQ
jgi:hypothetical protein